MSKSKKKNKNDISKEVAKVEEEIKEENIRKEKEIIKSEIIKEVKTGKHTFVHGFLVLVLLASLIYLIVSLFYGKSDSIDILINSLLLVLFTLVFVVVAIKTNKKKKSGFFLSGFILLIYFAFGSLSTLGYINFPSNKVIDFTGKSLTTAVEWSEKNGVNIIQDYEYSDMIEEYFIISQDVEPGTKVKDIKDIKIAVSEGPNPEKEIVIPSMISWTTERVLEFVKENYLSNVEVEFVESTKQIDTVIEQSKSGNLRRNEAIKLVFSSGNELDYDEVKLIDFTGKSKFEAMFYLKQHHLNYEFKEDFSSNIKKGYVIKQSVKAGQMVPVDGDKITITVSKGPEIKIPNLRGYSMSEITEWVIKNKLKLEFTDKYDDTVKENMVISVNYDEGEIVAEGTVIKVVISRGKLKMQEFESFSEFRDWAEKYSVNYEEQHQFSDDVEAGGVISYSYKEGATIKNNDSIIVIISDGKEAVVPNVVGQTKQQASSKLKNAGFNYNFINSYSSSVSEGKVIKQSIGAGSKVAAGTTITVTISIGPKPVSSGGSGSGGNAKPPTPTCDKSIGETVWIVPELISSDPGTTCSNIKNAYPKVKFSCQYVTSGPGKGLLVNSGQVDGKFHNYCDTYVLQIQN